MIPTINTGRTHAHWSHERFEKNFVSASGDVPLASSAKVWRVEAVDKAKLNDPVLNCNVCNARILNYVVLRNCENKNRLIIGSDCYGKFLHFLDSGKIECALPKLNDHVAGLKSYSKAIDRTMRGWFYERFDAGTLPEKVASIVESLRILGFAPSKDAADGLVDYYKATRKFQTEVIVPELKGRPFRSGRKVLWYSGAFPYRNLLPREITIDQIDRVKALIERQRAISLHLDERQRLLDERREVESRRQEQIRHDAWVETQPVIYLGTQSNRGSGFVGRIDGKIAIPAYGKPATKGTHRYMIRKAKETYCLIELLT